MKIFEKSGKKEILLIAALIIIGVVLDYKGLFKEIFIDESDTKSCEKLIKQTGEYREITLVDRTKCTWGRDILRYNTVDDEGDKIGVYCLSTDFNTLTFAKIQEKEVSCENYNEVFKRADKAIDNDEDIDEDKLVSNLLSQDIYFKTKEEKDIENKVEDAVIRTYSTAEDIEVELCEPMQNMQTAIVSFSVDDDELVRIWDSTSNQLTESMDEELNQEIADGSCPTTHWYDMTQLLERDRAMRKAVSSFDNSGEVRLIPEYGLSGVNMEEGLVVTESYSTNCKLPDYNLPIRYSKLSGYVQGYSTYLQQFSAGKYKLRILLAEIMPDADGNEAEDPYENAIDPTSLSCLDLAKLVAGPVIAGEEYDDGDKLLMLNDIGVSSAAEIYKLLKQMQ